MKMLKYLVVIVFCSNITQGWHLRKCVMSVLVDGISDCSGNRAAYCRRVTDLKVDTADLPADIQQLCINMENHTLNGALVNGTFARFKSLEYLQIIGCFFQINPGAFYGLSNLRKLELFGGGPCCEFAMSRQVFKDIPQLKEFKMLDFNFTVAANDVFYDLSQIEILYFYEPCASVYSKIICTITNLRSLKDFFYFTQKEEILEDPTCVFNNVSVFNKTIMPSISSVRLSFYTIKYFHERALDLFQNLSYLSFAKNDKLFMYLSRSGIKSVDFLNYDSSSLVVEDVCTVVFKLSVKKLKVGFHTVSNFSQFISDSCSMLEELNIYARLQPLDLRFIYYMTNLTTLTASTNGLCKHFEHICMSPVNVTWLTELNIQSTRIFTIFGHQFSCLVNLEKFNITSCSVSQIEPFAFMELISLRLLSLNYNNISVIRAHVFDGLYNLLVLDLQENPLLQIEEMAFRTLINLREIYFSYSGTTPPGFVMRWNLTHIFGNISQHLTYLFFAHMMPLELIIGSDIMLKDLNFHVWSSTLIIEDCERPFFQAISTLYARTEYILCGSQFIGKYIKNIEYFEYVSRFSDRIGDLTVINELVHLKKLTLYYVDLSKQSNVAVIFHNLTKLRELRLFHCRLFSIDGSLSKDLKSLTLLKFVFRDYITVYNGFFTPLTSLKNLYMDLLLLYCNCDNVEFSKWVKENKKVQAYVNIPEVDELQCLPNNGLGTLNLNVYGKDNCILEMEFVLFVLTSLGVSLFMLAVLLCRMNVYVIFPLYHIVRAWLEQVIRKDQRLKYRYDAFVSYCSKDENWVVNELLPNLEQRGPPFLRLCLHSRDFQLGKYVVDNITDSLYESRYTLCLVSRSYLSSNWCSLEMHLATCRLQVEHKDILILVFLEKIPSRLLSAHHRLARLVKTRTYLDWPQDPDQHNAFWDRLWDKLKPEAGH